ncbi:methyl-accepting chemotaxis protein [Novosphingobium sp.]|uniref:methyl-accepting chemotaxis protein n=1 Tax=Novosphingobium sp. TaxID=1874826 RepID=UPI0038B8426C
MDNQDPATKLAFFNLTQADTDRFPRVASAMSRLAPPALDRLYDKIAQTPQTAGFFTSRSAIEHGKAKQVEHWAAMFSGAPGERYFAGARKVGQIHAKIGLAPGWYIGAYASVLDEIVVAMASRAFGPFGKRFGQTIGTMLKMAMLDLELSISTYFEAEEQARAVVMDTVGGAMRALSAGEMDRPMPPLPAAFAALADDFEAMRTNVGAALSKVSETSGNVKLGAQEIRQASDDLARRTEQQAASLEETSAAMTGLASSVSATAGDASNLRDSVQQAHGDAQAGGAVVSEAVSAMNDIHQSAQEIGKIIAVIDGIAFQTNLLALNAGVEAARAGDAGRGFAVVANEVRALAQRSAEAALDIKKLIGASSTQVERGVALVGQTGGTFERIVGKVGEIAGLATSIAVAAGDQAQNIGLVRETVRALDVMTQQNAAMVEQATAAAANLANEADQMSSLVGHFRLGATGSAHGATASFRRAA